MFCIAVRLISGAIGRDCLEPEARLSRFYSKYQRSSERRLPNSWRLGKSMLKKPFFRSLTVRSVTIPINHIALPHFKHIIGSYFFWKTTGEKRKKRIQLRPETTFIYSLSLSLSPSPSDQVCLSLTKGQRQVRVDFGSYCHLFSIDYLYIYIHMCVCVCLS